jgi:hypothetical protein
MYPFLAFAERGQEPVRERRLAERGPEEGFAVTNYD